MARDEREITRAANAALARIKESARARGADTQKLITRYTLERWLHRITLTPYAKDFVLKGGMMMPLLGDEQRSTDDMDANLSHKISREQLEEMIRAVAEVEPEQEDGLSFKTDDIRISDIRDDAVPGVRVTFRALLQAEPRPTPIAVKIDLTYGDAITPHSRIASLPQAVKGTDAVSIAVYPWATVVAEKLHSVQRHGALNSRMKDFYDLLLIARSVELNGQDTVRAVQATFKRWQTVVQDEPTGFSPAFVRQKSKDWQKFAGSSSKLKLKGLDFTDVVEEIKGFAKPLLAAAAGRDQIFEGDWHPDEGWQYKNMCIAQTEHIIEELRITPIRI